jgi:hypothetical protein
MATEALTTVACDSGPIADPAPSAMAIVKAAADAAGVFKDHRYSKLRKNWTDIILANPTLLEDVLKMIKRYQRNSRTGADKCPPSAYLRFGQAVRTEVREALKAQGQEKPALKAVGFETSQRWKMLSPEERAVYMQTAKDAREAWQKSRPSTGTKDKVKRPSTKYQTFSMGNRMRAIDALKDQGIPVDFKSVQKQIGAMWREFKESQPPEPAKKKAAKGPKKPSEAEAAVVAKKTPAKKTVKPVKKTPKAVTAEAKKTTKPSTASKSKTKTATKLASTKKTAEPASGRKRKA